MVSSQPSVVEIMSPPIVPLSEIEIEIERSEEESIGFVGMLGESAGINRIEINNDSNGLNSNASGPHRFNENTGQYEAVDIFPPFVSEFLDEVLSNDPYAFSRGRAPAMPLNVAEYLSARRNSPTLISERYVPVQS